MTGTDVPDPAPGDGGGDAVGAGPVEESQAAAEVVLPDAVRRRVALYAAEVMRGFQPNQVPAGLRFAVRWGSGAVPRGFADRLTAALAADPEFRERIGTALAEADGLARAVVAGEADAASDPASVAAVLYLARPQRWQQRLEGVVAAMSAPRPADEELRRAQQDAADLRTKLDRLQQRRDRDVAAARDAAGQAKARLQAAVERLQGQLDAAAAALASAVAERDRLQREVGELDREVRRLRGQLEQAKSQADQSRTTDRESRLAANARAKALLEVLQGAAAGLADELALPPGTTAPADLVPAALPADRVLSKRLLSAPDLAEALTMPRCHLIVDGYNVSKGVWPQAALSGQRERLIAALATLQSRTGAEITVVFDGAEVGAVPAATSKAVRVRFSRAGELADRVIVRLAAAEPTGRPLLVVSSDAALASGARAAGARTVERGVLAELLRASR